MGNSSATKSVRRSERVPCNLDVHWIRRGVAVPASATDINAHGAFVCTELKAEVGELLQLVINLPDGMIQACVIARFVGTSQSGRGIGTELFVIAEGDRRRWNKFYRGLLRGDKPSPASRAELAV